MLYCDKSLHLRIATQIGKEVTLRDDIQKAFRINKKLWAAPWIQWVIILTLSILCGLIFGCSVGLFTANVLLSLIVGCLVTLIGLAIVSLLVSVTADFVMRGAIYAGIADGLLELGQIDEAKKFTLKILEGKRGIKDYAITQLISSLAYIGRIQESQNLIQKLERNNWKAEAFGSIAYGLFRAGQQQEVNNAFNQAKAQLSESNLTVNNPRAVIAVLHYLVLAGEYQLALEGLNHWQNIIDPKLLAEPVAIVLAESGQFDLALDVIAKFELDDMIRARVWTEMARYLYDKEPDKSLSLFRKSLSTSEAYDTTSRNQSDEQLPHYGLRELRKISNFDDTDIFANIWMQPTSFIDIWRIITKTTQQLNQELIDSLFRRLKFHRDLGHDMTCELIVEVSEILPLLSTRGQIFEGYESLCKLDPIFKFREIVIWNKRPS